MCRAARRRDRLRRFDRISGRSPTSRRFRLRPARSGQGRAPLCYPEPDIGRWAGAAKAWAAGGRAEGLPYVTDEAPPAQPRETFVFSSTAARSAPPLAHRR
ncbi:MAG: hypothetical protein WDN24_21275 [Sphingomonas sp.]